MWQSVEILNASNTLTLKQIFWETKTFFKKREYHFLVENTKNIRELSSIIFLKALILKMHHFHTKPPYQKLNVKTNRMVSTKWIYHKNVVLPVTSLFFWTFCFSLRTPYTKGSFDVPMTQMPIFVLFVSVGVLFDGAFSLLVSLKYLKSRPFQKSICAIKTHYLY